MLYLNQKTRKYISIYGNTDNKTKRREKLWVKQLHEHAVNKVN